MPAATLCLLLLFRKAWAEEEAKVQRSMVSYVLLRTRKSDNTRPTDCIFANTVLVLIILQGESSEPGHLEGDGKDSSAEGSGTNILLVFVGTL